MNDGYKERNEVMSDVDLGYNPFDNSLAIKRNIIENQVLK